MRPGSRSASPAWNAPGPGNPCDRPGRPAGPARSAGRGVAAARGRPGPGPLDELAARQDRRLTPGERARLRELTAELERLDKLVESTPKNLDQAERARRFEDLKRQRELASIALGEFQTKLVADYGPLAGQVATLNEIQAALPADAALVAWVDIKPQGPNAADPDGEHWGVVVRSGASRPGSRSRDRSGRVVDRRRHGLAEPGPGRAAEAAGRRLGRPAAPGREVTRAAPRAVGQGSGRTRPRACRRPGG